MRLLALLLFLCVSTTAWADDAPPAAAPTPPAAVPVSPAAPVGPRVRMSTTMGDIVLRLDKAHAPLTVANFLRYAEEGHYTGTVVYRVVPGFLIQAGSWDADMKGRPVHKGIALETDNGLANVRGAIAMAHGDDPMSTMAEFFIDLADNPSLDRHPGDPPANSFVAFGHVEQGMDVVDRIAAVPLGGGKGPFASAAPVTPIVILKVGVVPDQVP